MCYLIFCFLFALGMQLTIMSITFSLCLLFNLIGLIGVVKENIPICFVYGIILSIGTVRQLFVSLQDRHRKISILMPLAVIMLIFTYINLIKKKFELSQRRLIIGNVELNLTDVNGQLNGNYNDGQNEIFNRLYVSMRQSQQQQAIELQPNDDKPPPYEQVVSSNQ